MGKKLAAAKKADQVWLAGLGALVIAEQEGSDLFQQLVRKGKEFKRTEEGGQEIELFRVKARAVAPSIADRQRKQSAPVDMEQVKARQARRLESARRAVLKEFGTLEESGKDYERLKQARRIFTVTHGNATYVPGFQFDDRGRPHPAVAKVIQILGKQISDWGLALWFTAPNGWLDGKRPVDLLNEDPKEVVQAAEHEAAELVF